MKNKIISSSINSEWANDLQQVGRIINLKKIVAACRDESGVESVETTNVRVFRVYIASNKNPRNTVCSVDNYIKRPLAREVSIREGTGRSECKSWQDGEGIGKGSRKRAKTGVTQRTHAKCECQNRGSSVSNASKVDPAYFMIRDKLRCLKFIAGEWKYAKNWISYQSDVKSFQY